jgi:hypothetical protein
MNASRGLDDPQPLRGPLAERRAVMRLHPVANGNDRAEVVMLRFIGLAIRGSYPEFPDN